VFCSELIQRLAQVGMQMLGLYGQLEFNTKWAPLRGKIERLYLTSVSGTIAGGTSEIQRNIIAERGLGLPR
jgi:alkylation response protein AidB-like acyl-CoA dehydrogenase